MKFKIDLDIDWVGEKGLDETVKQGIVKEIVSHLGQEVEQQIVGEALERVNQSLDKFVAAFFNRLLKEGVTITDEWGGKQREGVTVEALAREKLQKALSEKVDEHGSASYYSENRRTRLEWLVDQRIKKVVDVQAGEIAKQFDAKLKEIFGAALRDRLTESLLKNIDLEALLAGKVASKEGA